MRVMRRSLRFGHTLALSTPLVAGLAQTVPATSDAQEAPAFNLAQFHPAPDVRGGGLTWHGARAMPQWRGGAHLLVDYAASPLVRVNEDGDRVATLVGSQTTVHVLGTLGLAPRFDLGVAMPLVLTSAGDSAIPGALDEAAFTPGDLRLVPRVTLYQPAAGAHTPGIAVALVANVWVPTGDSDAYAGEGFRGEPRVAVDWLSESGLRIGGNLGWQFRPNASFLNLEVSSALTWSVGAEIPVQPVLHFVAEVFGSAGLAAGEVNREEAPLEALLAARVLLDDWVLQAGAGLGIINGFGTPDWRGLVSFGWSPPVAAPAPPPPPPPPPADRDGDGVPDALDNCPDVTNPDQTDTDGNGVGDACQAPGDRDGDGIPDDIDQCPDAAEDFDGFEDGDGCPDEDNDRDGILDFADQCPNEAEDLDGFEDDDGCPDPDNDGDGIPDVLDQCPNEPETINGVDDDDGCPDEGETRVQIEGNQIVILDMVYFDTNRDTIQPRSYPILDQVASVLRLNPQIGRIEVQGHTDSQGNDASNLELSQRRANAVVRYLSETGRVDTARLLGTGYGETRPIADNGTRDGRAANRRVEFHIITE